MLTGVLKDAMAEAAGRQGSRRTNDGTNIGSVRSLFDARLATCESVSERSALLLDPWCLFLAAAPCAISKMLLLLLPAPLLSPVVLEAAKPSTFVR